ncbi:MAG TPA: serine/threonine-protein kinase [Thermoanaerobaculia bacterium]|jgi:serine/threonine-protein kinase|nr:serine/threonine-protein kinase [Thermoanaerobaculia bacterium]
MNVLRVGRYRVLQHLGGGGSAEVYLAEDTVMRRKVALKVLRRLEADERDLRHFEREIRSASMINHPNILTILDVGTDDEVQYIASEYVEGESLRQRMSHGRMDAAEVLDVAMGVAGALAAAHEAWVVHRDVKPENIMLRRGGGVKVLDFGVATIAGGGDGTDPLRRARLGTLYYLSPEQVRGESVIDTRSDIYSLGVVLYEMLAGYPPFDGMSAMDILALIVEGAAPPLPVDVPVELHGVVQRAMRKSIYERTQTAQALLDELAELRLDVAITQREASTRDHQA